MQDHVSVDTLLAGGVPNVVEHTLCPSKGVFFYVINFSFCGYVDLRLHGCTVVLLYLSIFRYLPSRPRPCGLRRESPLIGYSTISISR